jgi:PST family polysaccharide transporter
MNAWWTRYLPEILREWLDGRVVLQKTIGNTGWLVLERILRMAIGLTVGSWVARYLGPQQFGELAYVISFLAFFQAFSRLEADKFVVRDVVQTREAAHIVLGTTLWLRISAGLVSWILAVLFMYISHPTDHRLVLLTAIVGGTLVFQAAETVDLWFQSQSQSRRTVLAKFSAFAFSNGVKVALLLAKAPLIAFAGVMCLECAALSCSLAIAYRRIPTDNRWQVSSRQAKVLMLQCWPFILSGLMIATYSRIDQIMIKEMLGETELGIFAAALPISAAWNILSTTLIISLAPAFAMKKARDEQEYNAALARLFRFFALMALIGATLMSLTAPWIIKILYGPQYQASAAILRIHVFVNLFLFQGEAQSLWVINNNVQAVTVLGTFMAATTSIISNFFLISKFGLLGAPFSILIAECVAVVLIPCLFRKDLRELYKKAFFCAKIKG